MGQRVREIYKDREAEILLSRRGNTQVDCRALITLMLNLYRKIGKHFMLKKITAHCRSLSQNVMLSQ